LVRLAVLGAHDARAIAGGELAQPAHGEHRVEHRHALAVRERLRSRDLPDDLHLAENAGRLRHDDVDLRRAHVLREHLLDVAGLEDADVAAGDGACGAAAPRTGPATNPGPISRVRTKALIFITFFCANMGANISNPRRRISGNSGARLEIT